MRTLLTILFCCLLSLMVSGQEEVVEHGYGIEIGAHQGNHRLSSNRGLPQFQLVERDSLESGVPGYSVGLLYTSRVNRIGFTTGLRYLTTGYDIDQSPLPGGQAGETYSRKARAAYLSVPFELNFYQDIKPRNRVFFTLGAAAHFHLKTDITESIYQDGELKYEGLIEGGGEQVYRSPIISFNTSLGFDKKLNDRWSARMEPYFQFFLQGNEKKTADGFNRNYYQLGVRFMVRRFIL